jgi:hypothetical protein
MPRAIVAIGGCEDRTRLCPARTQGRVTAAIPGQQAQAVLRSPAVASRVGQKGLIAVVHGSRTFHDWDTILLPALSRCRENLGGTDCARRRELCDAKRLEAIGHARPDEVAAPAVKANNTAVDTPNIVQGGEVGVGLEGIAATCISST